MQSENLGDSDGVEGQTAEGETLVFFAPAGSEGSETGGFCQTEIIG